MKLTKLQTKIIIFMTEEKAHFVMPKDIDFVTEKGFYRVMAYLEAKELVIRKCTTVEGIPYFEGYSITQKALSI